MTDFAFRLGPGNGLKRQAALYRKTAEALIETPYQKIAPNLVSKLNAFQSANLLTMLQENGTALPCFVTQHMANMQEGDTTHDLQTIKNCAAVMFIAGADTVSFSPNIILEVAHVFIFLDVRGTNLVHALRCNSSGDSS